MLSHAIFIASTTFRKSGEAKRLAKEIIRRGLGACVHIYPLESFYRWNDRLQHHQEIVMMIFTEKSCLSKLERTVRALHSYELPPFVAWPVSNISAPYAAWLKQCLHHRSR